MGKPRHESSAATKEASEAVTTRNQAKWELAPGFKASWKRYLALSPGIKDAMTEFDQCKRSVPPLRLPGKMKEHKLDGPLKGFYDCHLADDVILIYKPIAGGAYKLIELCDHADLKGPKAKALIARIK
jgi:mRNA-degrading endonuclease YafQ of YafQ-DinJ toxin-antitoxin module